MLSKQVPYTMAKQVSFDIFAKLLYALSDNFKLKPGQHNPWIYYIHWNQVVMSLFFHSRPSLTFRLSTLLSALGDMKWAISIASAFLASILACLSSQPGDMILSATYGRYIHFNINVTECMRILPALKSILPWLKVILTLPWANLS